MLADCSPAQPAQEGAQGLRGNQVVSAATYIVSGIQVTASIDEELNQGGDVVPHGKVHWRGSLLEVGETQISWQVPIRTAQLQVGAGGRNREEH